MSTSSPPPGQPPQEGQPSYGVGESLEQPTPRRPRRGLIAGIVIGVVAAVALPLGAFAVFRALSGGGTQPHEVLPASALAYFRIDVDPSASQKINALRFLDHFPSFSEETKIDDPEQDVREVIFDAIAADTGCRDVSFGDVDAWLGERYGFAVLPPEGRHAQPGFAAAIQVSSEQEARDGFAELAACGGSEAAADDAGIAYLDGYLIVSETQRQAEGLAEAAAESSLADSEQFATDMERLGEPGVATLWMSGAGLMESFGGLMGSAGMASAEAVASEAEPVSWDTGNHAFAESSLASPRPDAMMEQLGSLVDDYFASVAVAFRFEPNHAEIAAVVSGDAYEPLAEANTVDMELPESTMLALGYADGDRHIETQWKDMMGLMSGPGMGGMDPEQVLEQLEAQTGLELPADLQTLLGSNFTLAVDTEGIDSVFSGGDPTALNIGARVATDPQAFADLLVRLEQLAAEGGVPLKLAQAETDDGVVVASNQGYASTLTESGSLPDSDAFQAAVADADTAQSVLFFNFDVVEEQVLQLASNQDAGQQVADNLRPIQAVGASSVIEDGYTEGTLRLTVND